MVADPMWPHTLTVTRLQRLAIILLVSVSACAHSTVRDRRDNPRHVFNGASGGWRSRPLTDEAANRLLPYEADEDTNVRERQILPRSIANKNSPLVELGRRLRGRLPREAATGIHIRDEGNRRNDTKTNNEKELNKEVWGGQWKPKILKYYGSLRAAFLEKKRQLSERFERNLHQSLPRGVPEANSPRTTMFRLGDGDSLPPTRGSAWPMPMSFTANPDRVFLVHPDRLALNLTENSSDSDVIRAALVRVSSRLALLGTAKTPRPESGRTVGSVRSLYVTVRRDDSVYPHLQANESYVLTVDGGEVRIEAPEVWGSLHGLETFIQMVYACGPHQLCVNASEVRDSPRYAYRGLLVDTARHYLAPRLLKMTMDAMAMNKLNVLHWHVVDDQSFPFVSRTFPRLSDQGAFSRAETYDHDVIRDLVNYGRLRGVRIIPEFDTPCHSWSWGAGHPELLTQCSPKGLGPIDPTINITYDLLTRLFSEIKALFPARELHLGGDECAFSCWLSNRHIVDFMRDQGYGMDFFRLLQHYFNRLCDQLSATGEDRDYMFWQEATDGNIKLPENSIVQVWKFWGEGVVGAMRRLTKAGLRVVYSAHWYLDDISQDWGGFYREDPRQYVESESAKRLVVGGEACVWGEYIDNNNLLQITWPRAAAVAERLWSPEYVRDVGRAKERLKEHRCRMIRLGIPSTPLGPGTCS